MSVKSWLLGLSVTALCLTACAAQRTPPEIARVRFSADSGPLPPEYQYFEEIVITRGAAALTRGGKAADTLVNAGSWQIALDEPGASGLFETLAALDCAGLKREEAPDAPDGAGTLVYAIEYAGGGVCELYFDPGASYPGSETLVQAVDAFIAGLAFPPEALPRVQP